MRVIWLIHESKHDYNSLQTTHSIHNTSNFETIVMLREKKTTRKAAIPLEVIRHFLKERCEVARLRGTPANKGGIPPK